MFASLFSGSLKVIEDPNALEGCISQAVLKVDLIELIFEVMFCEEFIFLSIDCVGSKSKSLTFSLTTVLSAWV